MTTSHAPAVAFDGGVNVQVISVEDCTLTLVAVIFGIVSLQQSHGCPDWKFVAGESCYGYCCSGNPFNQEQFS